MTLRDIENASIRAFVQQAADDGYLSGRVLDYGCGKQPYRDIVEVAGAHYEGYDDPSKPASVVSEAVGEDLMFDANAWDSILVTQVIQYQQHPEHFVAWIHEHLFTDGYLVMTYPTNWPEVEVEDLHRFTKAGMERLLTEAGFTIIRHERRAQVLAGTGSHDLNEFALGYGVVARA